MINHEIPLSDCNQAELATATHAASLAAQQYAKTPAVERGHFLRTIAERLEMAGDELLEVAHRETSLPLPRLTGERARTCGQLRMFAELISSDRWLDVRIERADPGRQPQPKPDLRRTQTPLGPIAVFAASNFPLAFSVPGGDTASALAAGCPVVLKAHPGHPITSQMGAEAISQAVKACGLPEGTFSMVTGGPEVGRELVLDDRIYGVAFTGSLRAGRAIYDLAARRKRPIPVFSEMGSVNPVFLLPGAMEARSSQIAKGFADSLVLGVGQFCTNPGLLVVEESPQLETFLQIVADHLRQVTPGRMLYPALSDAYEAGTAKLAAKPSLSSLLVGKGTSPALFSVSAEEFLQDEELKEELFGPAATVIRCKDLGQMVQIAEWLEGQLTATVHFEEEDGDAVETMLPSLVKMAGRIIANGFPTGVEVNSAMHHGGPYPATTDSRFTSVGTAAIARFVRPVAFQDFPSRFLPRELQE